MPQTPNRTDTTLVYTVEQAAMRLGINKWTYYELIKRGELPAIRIGRLLKVPKRAIDALLEQAPRTP
jgi:excisionase family DNA binding protein